MYLGESIAIAMLALHQRTWCSASIAIIVCCHVRFVLRCRVSPFKRLPIFKSSAGNPICLFWSSFMYCSHFVISTREMAWELLPRALETKGIGNGNLTFVNFSFTGLQYTSRMAQQYNMTALEIYLITWKDKALPSRDPMKEKDEKEEGWGKERMPPLSFKHLYIEGGKYFSKALD